MILTQTLRLIGFALGSVLHLFLAVLLVAKRRAGIIERLTFAAVAAAGLWHISNAVASLHRATMGSHNQTLLAVLDWAGKIGGLLAPLLMVAAVISGLRSRPPSSTPTRQFAVAFTLSLVVLAGGLLAGLDSASFVFASLAPPACLAWFVYRHHFLGVTVSTRVVFALALGFLSTLYLLIVRRLVDVAELELEAFGPLVELILIFAAAAIGWYPLYGWMTRFLSRRTQLYADFSKRLIQEGVGLLDLGHRLQFLAEEVGRTFALDRALLVTSGERRTLGAFGYDGALPPDLDALEEAVRKRRADLVSINDAAPDVRAFLTSNGFQHLFALWYEDHLAGLLLVDARREPFIEDNQAILLGLSHQVAQSIETGRLIEAKISLERALLEQEHLATLGGLTATIAHEVKNPLSSIKTLAQVMREDTELDARYREDLSYMISEIDRLNSCVQQLLTFSRPVLRPAASDAHALALPDLIENTSRMLAREYASQQIRIEQRVEADLTLLGADHQSVQQIVLNLALNAVQASGPNTTVRLEAARRPDGKVVITVTDEGPGVPIDLRERIFEPFYTTKQKGTGLGLAIVKKNVRNLRGEIELTSPVAGGRGARVTVTLPSQ